MPEKVECIPFIFSANTLGNVIMKQLKNKVAVVTGAASGIGQALAQRLSQQGVHLALSDKNLGGLEQTRNLLTQDIRSRSDVLDISDKNAFLDYASKVIDEFGPIDIVINNAGITISGAAVDLSLDDFEQVLAVNLWGVIYGTKAFLPHLLARPEAAIINISSVFGMVGAASQAAYCASKFGVRGFTETLWQELDDTSVLAMSVHPGGTATNIAKAHDPRGVLGARIQKASAKLLTTRPEVIADAIIDGLKQGKRRVVAGNLSKPLELLPRILPTRYWKLQKRLSI